VIFGRGYTRDWHYTPPRAEINEWLWSAIVRLQQHAHKTLQQGVRYEIRRAVPLRYVNGVMHSEGVAWVADVAFMERTDWPEVEQEPADAAYDPASGTYIIYRGVR